MLSAVFDEDIGMQSINVRWLLSVVGNWLIIALSMLAAAASQHWAVYLIAIFVIGTRQHAVGILGHDGAHWHVSQVKWLNDAMTSLLCLWPMGIGLHGYRKFHFTHHRTVGTEDDPELVHRRRFSDKWHTNTNKLKLFITDLIGFGWREVLFILKVARPQHPIDVIGPVLTIGFLVALLLWLGYGQLVVLWYVALYTSFWAVFRLRAYTEHVGTESTHRLEKPSLWRRWIYLPANTWLHWEHHRWPAVPTWRLQKQNEKTPDLSGLAAERPSPLSDSSA